MSMKRLFTNPWETKETKVALILSIALFLSVVFYCFGTRYQTVATERFAYMHNRITGTCWFYTPNGYEKLDRAKWWAIWKVYHLPTIFKRWLGGAVGAGIVLGFILFVVEIFRGWNGTTTFRLLSIAWKQEMRHHQGRTILPNQEMF